MPLLEVKELVKIYNRRRVVDEVSFHVDAGEIVGLLGRNGAGKTTTFRMTVGMIKPKAGRISFDGRDMTSWPMYKRARAGIGYLSQEPSVFQKLSVFANVVAILETMKVPRKEIKKKAADVLGEFGLSKLSDSPASVLSGGERRRLEIARTLVREPKLILLDEPFSGVDPIAVNDLQEIIRDLSGRGIGILLTDHNVRETLSITSRSYIIDAGSVIADGTPFDLVVNDLVRKTYLGEKFKL